MNYLTEQEITEKCIIMIELENGDKIPYYVNSKGRGGLTRATTLIGYNISDLIETPSLYPLRPSFGERFYISNDEVTGIHRDVKGYRRLTPEEKDECASKLDGIEHLKTIKDLLFV